MKILLITDIPPCQNDPFGRQLNDLCLCVPPGGLVCFATIDGGLKPQWDPRLDWMPRRVVFKPGEFGLTSNILRKPARAAGMLREYGRRLLKVPNRIKSATAFGREQGVDTVWAVLRGQTSVRMAAAVAGRLGARLVVQATDPISWWLASRLVDPPNRKSVESVYRNTVKAASSVAVPSQSMAEMFRERYGVNAIALTGGIDPALAPAPVQALKSTKEVVIGVVTPLPNSLEFADFVRVLNEANWQVAGKTVKIHVLERFIPIDGIPPANLLSRVDHTQEELIHFLRTEVDIVYCAQPFDARNEEATRYKLPYEIVVGSAAGLPILYHGPEYSFGYQFLLSNRVGVLAQNSEGAAAYRELERLVSQPDLFDFVACTGLQAFHSHLSLPRLKRSFASFLGISEALLRSRENFSSAIGSNVRAGAGAETASAEDPIRAYALRADLARAEDANERLLLELARERSVRNQGDLRPASPRSDDLNLAVFTDTTGLNEQPKNLGLGRFAEKLLMQRLELANQNLLARLSVEKTDSDAMRAEVVSLKEKLAPLYAAHADAERKIDGLKADLAAMEQTANTIRKLEGELRDALNKAEANSAARVAAEQGLQRMGQLDRTIATLRDEAVVTEMQHRAALAALQDAVTETAARHDAAIADVVTARSQAEALQEQIASLQADLASVTDVLSLKTSEVLSSANECAEAITLVASVRAENETLRQQVAATAGLADQIRSSVEGVGQSILSSVDTTPMEGRIAGRLTLITAELAALKRRTSDKGAPSNSHVRELYLDLLEESLCGKVQGDPNIDPWSAKDYDADRRSLGRDWPKTALTMIGTVRMRNVRKIVESVLEADVPGDFLEAGVWRGGACIYMRGILQAYADQKRCVWVADSFAGLPKPDPSRYPADANDQHHSYPDLAVSCDEVRENFRRYGLLDEQVLFLEGWFKDTLPQSPVEQLAVLRLDGDMYGSTMDTLQALYDRVSPGGYVIVDDYILAPCRQAITDFRNMRGITEAIEEVDGAAVFWRKAVRAADAKSASRPAQRGSRARGRSGPGRVAAE